MALSLVFWNLNRSKWFLGLSGIYVFWACHFISGMFWVSKGMEIYSRVSAEKALVITLFIGLVYALLLTIPWLLYCRTRLNSPTRLMLFPLLWVFTEWLRYWLFDGLIWLVQGYGHQSTWLSGWIPVFGSLGASFFSALTAALVVPIIQSADLKHRLICTAFIVLIWTTGAVLSTVDWTRETGASIPVTAVQANRPVTFNPSLLGNRTGIEHRNRRWVDELKQLSLDQEQPGLLIWPEGSLKLKPKDLDRVLGEISESTESGKLAFFGGGPYYPDADNSNHFFNSIYGLGTASGKYHKVHRAPLGEYSPLGGRLGKVIPWLNSIEPPPGFGSAQQQPLAFSFNDESFIAAVSICYEIAFANHIRQHAGEANLLLNLSNDAWFNGTRELDQALQIAQIRALEHQKPMIRSTNSGLTASIDYKGHIIQQAPRETFTVFASEIRPRTGNTPYSRWGDSLVFIVALLPVLTLCLRKRLFRHR